MTSGYRGLYINLDRSPERRAHMEEQLARFGLQDRYERFPATDGATLPRGQSPLRPGEIGVFHSHCRALEAARDRRQCVHVIEDDALLSKHVAPVIEGAVAANLFDRYDMVFTDMLVHCHFGFLKTLKQRFDQTMFSCEGPLRLNQLQIIDLSTVFHAGFQSYIVGANAIDKLIALYRQEMAKGPSIPVDIFIQQQVLGGKLRAACLFPFITSFRLEDTLQSTIFGDERASQPTVTVMDVLRYLFFIDCDFDHAKRVLDLATTANRKATDRRHALIVQAAEFVLSNDFAGSS